MEHPQENDLATSAAAGNEQKRQAIEITEEARHASQQLTLGGKLFMGAVAGDIHFAFPEQSAADRAVGDRVIAPFIDYLKKHLDPEQVDATRTIPADVIAEMKKMGIFALKIPKEYGGLELSQTNYCRLVMAVASHCASTAVLISAHQSIGVPQPLKMFGSPEQKKKFLPRFREGAISAFALTEPDVGSDPAQMSATATLSEDGRYYILNGSKLWCTNGTIADIIIVMAQTAPKLIKGKERKQITALILEMNTPGVKVVHRCEFMGLSGICNGLLTFTDVKIPVENVLGGEGRGLSIALGTINIGRLTLPAACTGAAKQCLSIARRWGKERVQWGLPIGLHEAGREKIAFIAATTLAMEAMSWLTCAWADRGNIDIRIEAAMAKLFCTEALWKIIDMTLQLRGGRGYEKGSSLQARGEVPYPVERMMRDSRINTILEGSSEIMKLFLAREAIDPHLKRAGVLLNPKAPIGQKLTGFFQAVAFYSSWYPQKWWKEHIGTVPKDAGLLAPYLHFVEKRSHKLAKAIFHAMVRYQQKLEQRQMLLGRLMEIGCDLFAITSVCSYALMLQKKTPDDTSAVELADYFCRLARRRIDHAFRALSKNDDKVANIIAKKALDKSYRWLEEGIVWLGPDN